MYGNTPAEGTWVPAHSESGWGYAYVPRTKENQGRDLQQRVPTRRVERNVGWGKCERRIAFCLRTAYEGYYTVEAQASVDDLGTLQAVTTG